MKEAPENPPRGPEAFEQLDDPEAIQAQAAILLAVGAELRGDRAATQARSAAVAQASDMFMKDELDEFPIPRLVPPARRVSSRDMLRRYGAAKRDTNTMAEVAEDLYATRSTTAAAALAEMAMDHWHPLVRVSAAHAALSVMTETKRAYAKLVEGTKHEDELVRTVAATALARYRPNDPALLSMYVELPPPVEGTAQTSTMSHGTFAANGRWWRPGGDFWTYVNGAVWNDLYPNADVFCWSGGYSHGDREQGADLLVAWTRSHSAMNLSLMGHSHGASVMLLATWKGPTFGRLVLLSSPVHPSRYNANFSAVQKVVSIRVKFDLVLLADGSASRFSDPRYNERVLRVWFNHSATHDPDVWKKYNVPSML